MSLTLCVQLKLSVACIQYIVSMDLVTVFAIIYSTASCFHCLVYCSELQTTYQHMVSCDRYSYYTASLESGVPEQLELLYKHWTHDKGLCKGTMPFAV